MGCWVQFFSFRCFAFLQEQIFVRAFLIWFVLSVIPFTADKKKLQLWADKSTQKIHRAAGSHPAKLRQLRFSVSQNQIAGAVALATFSNIQMIYLAILGTQIGGIY